MLTDCNVFICCCVGTRVVFPVADIKVLEAGKTDTVELSREQCAALIAASFFCLHAVKQSNKTLEKGQKRSRRRRRNAQGFQSFNFSRFFAFLKGMGGNRQVAKLRCILHYFERAGSMLKEEEKSDSEHKMVAISGTVAFHRRSLSGSGEADSDKSLAEILSQLASELRNDKTVLVPFEVKTQGRIEDKENIGSIQIDFANRYIGGGVLGSGCVQEEIRFVVSPECLCSLLFCQAMCDAEAICIIGAEQFSSYTGLILLYCVWFVFCDRT